MSYQLAIDLTRKCGNDIHTWRKRLLQLLGLVVVLEDKGVQVAVASDLELGLVLDARLLDARRWEMLSASGRNDGLGGYFLQEASLRRQISMKDLMSVTS